jgi:hypothetical protein
MVCSRDDALLRLRTAGAYLEVAGSVLAERGASEYRNVAAGLSVLAGVAASDVICGIRLGKVHRGDDHRGAAELLKQATPDGGKLAAELRRLLNLKDAAHCGVLLVSARNAADAKRWAGVLVERATEEAER